MITSQTESYNRIANQYEDPFYNDVPWEIIYDEKGHVIGVVYLLLPKKIRKARRSHDLLKRR